MPYVKAITPGVVVAGRPIVETLRIKTIDTGYARPGAMVVRDTDDNHCKVGASGDAGVFGFIMPEPKLDVTTDFTTEDYVNIGHGPGVVVTLPCDTTNAAGIVKGDPLYVGAHGRVYKGSTDVTKIVGWAEGTQAYSLTAGLLNVRLAK